MLSFLPAARGGLKSFRQHRPRAQISPVDTPSQIGQLDGQIPPDGNEHVCVPTNSDPLDPIPRDLDFTGNEKPPKGCRQYPAAGCPLQALVRERQVARYEPVGVLVT